jgi:hypothetical protein
MATSSNRYRPQCVDPRLVARDQVFVAVVAGGSECDVSQTYSAATCERSGNLPPRGPTAQCLWHQNLDAQKRPSDGSRSIHRPCRRSLETLRPHGPSRSFE